MAISFAKYVKISSGVGGTAAASRRDLGLRVFTSNSSLAYRTILVCQNSDDVGAAFGTSSKEYAIASNYFGYVSNSITKANQISFVRWINTSNLVKITTIKAANEPLAMTNFKGDLGIKFQVGTSNALISISVEDTYDELDHTDIANMFTASILDKSQESGYAWMKGGACSFEGGSFSFTFMDESASATQGPDVKIVDFTDSVVTDARSIMGLRNFNVFKPAEWVIFNEPDVPAWVASTSYKVGDFVKQGGTFYCCKKSHTSGSTFESTNWSAKPSSIASWSDSSSYAVGSWTDHGGLVYCAVTSIAAPTGTNPIIDRTGSVSKETPDNALSRVNREEDNFGSLMFVEALTDSEKKRIAAVNKEYNYKYIFLTNAVPGGYTATAAALNGYECTAATYENRQTEFAEFMPAALFASTDYSRVNSTKTFMYKQFTGINPSVGLKTDLSPAGQYAHLYEDLDSKHLNYYGETMKSGKPLRFYQDGVCMDGLEIAVACNEIWFKDAIQTEIINLFIAMEKVPANSNGAAMVEMMIDGVCTEALNNGTIIKAKSFTNAQKAYIDTLAGETDAWKSVMTNGYWKKSQIKQETTAGGVKYVADYVLIYSKGDAIRKVNGSNVMI